MFSKVKEFFRSCGFLGHDWEIIESKPIEDICREYDFPIEYGDNVVNRICLRCGERREGITNFIKAGMERKETAIKRKEKARRLWDCTSIWHEER